MRNPGHPGRKPTRRQRVARTEAVTDFSTMSELLGQATTISEEHDVSFDGIGLACDPEYGGGYMKLEWYSPETDEEFSASVTRWERDTADYKKYFIKYPKDVRDEIRVAEDYAKNLRLDLKKYLEGICDDE